MHPFIILKRVNVVFEAFRGQLRRPQMFLEFYRTYFLYEIVKFNIAHPDSINYLLAKIGVDTAENEPEVQM